MKVLVTGANGFLGIGVTEKLLDRDNMVIAADFSVDRIDYRADKRVCNIFAIDNPYQYFEKPDVFLHLAWQDGFNHYSKAHIDNLPSHFTFIKKMAEAGCKHIAIMGSMHEVGFFEGSVNEATPCHPSTPYGISKNTLRKLAEIVCGQNHCILQWLRGFYIVGNSQYGSSVFSKITESVRAGKSEFPLTKGQNQYDFLDYPVFCEQVAAAITQNAEQGIINICSGSPEKLADRVERFIKENNYTIKLQYGAFPDRSYDSKAIWGDSTKIERIMKG